MAKPMDITGLSKVLGVIILASGSTLATNSFFGPGGDYQRLVTAQANSEVRSEERWIAANKASKIREGIVDKRDEELNKILSDGFLAISASLMQGAKSSQERDRLIVDLTHADAIQEIRDAQQDAVVESLENIISGVIARLDDHITNNHAKPNEGTP